MSNEEKLLDLYEDRHMTEYYFTLLHKAELDVKKFDVVMHGKYRGYDSHDLSEVYKGLCEDLGCICDAIEALEE